MEATASDSAPAAPSDKQSAEDGTTKQGISFSVAPGALSETPKVSLLTPKSGLNFVIPKNKLSGALVPVTRPGSKWEPEVKKEDLKQPSRKTKWGPDPTQDPAVKRGRALALQTRAEQIAAQLESGNLELENSERERSPSPPPIYDSLGHRVNTREGRKREQLDIERREAIGECMKLNPSYKPPSGFKAVAKEAKLFIPAREYPGYNFIGLILGPRGNTQKRMEAETGAKITIRGKGAVKEGKLQPIRRDGRDTDGAFEDLHVHISADTFEKVDAAVALIQPLLTPVDEERNIHKMKQLRELAEMNGTVRDFTRICTFCGEIGHREWQCPRDKLQTFQAKVICRLCGDGGHPTIDCPLKFSGQGKVIDKEYLSFLEELGGGFGGIDSSSKSDEIHPPGAEPSTQQPMLLTAAGAQPMPERWPGQPSGEQAGDGGADLGGFPRFPFPIPPPGSLGRGGFDFFLQRFLHPSMLNLFRGLPPPPSPPGLPFPPPTLQMMARMFPAFRGRFPFPPFGLRPDMRPPVSSMMPDSQPSIASDGSELQAPKNADASASDTRVESSTESRPEDTPVVSSAFPSSSPSSMVPSSTSSLAPTLSAAISSPATSSMSTVPTFSPVVASVPTFTPVTPGPPPVLPSIASNTVVPPTALHLPQPSSTAPSPVLPPVQSNSVSSMTTLPSPLPSPMTPAAPAFPGIPSVRPALPSVRPVHPVTPVVSSAGTLPTGMQTPFMPAGVAKPFSEGTSNVSTPPQPWGSNATHHPNWSQPQASLQLPQALQWQQLPKYSSEAQDKSLSLAHAPHSFTSQVTPVAISPAASEPVLKAWGNAVPPPPPSGPGPTPLLPSPVPFARPPASGPLPSPFSSFTAASPQIPQNQFPVSPLSSSVYQPRQVSPISSSHSNPMFSQMRPILSSTSMQSASMGDTSSSLVPNQRLPLPSQNFSFQSQDTYRNQSFQQSALQTSEGQSGRPWQASPVGAGIAPVGSQLNTEFRGSVHPGYANAGWVPPSGSSNFSFDDDRGSKRSTSLFPPTSSDREMGYGREPPFSRHSLLQPEIQRPPSASSNQWMGNPAPVSSIRPNAQPAQLPPLPGGAGMGQFRMESPYNVGRPQLHNAPLPQKQEVDPEYEKLMASVGVL